jgi:outer membrane immunogenic protein
MRWHNLSLMVRRMKLKTLLLFAALLAPLVDAHAADMPLKAPPLAEPVAMWSGPYVGLNGGYGWGSSSQRDTTLFIPGDGDYSVRGGFVGGTIGYSAQISDWLLGLEGDYAWSGIKGSSVTCGGTNECGTKLRSFGTLRARLGPLMGNTLLYVTGGAALGDIYAYDVIEPTANGSKMKWGWTAGGGVERRLNETWSVKLEYLYINFGTDSYFTITNHTPEQVNLKLNIVRAGINYRF